jgi:hypothetical protein
MIVFMQKNESICFEKVVSIFYQFIKVIIIMSYSKVNNKMHCKVCESAGKSEKEVKSHYPKNRDGFTVCPTLLSQECRYCNKKGHTVKYCTIKKKDEDNTWVLQQERKYASDKASFGTTFSKGCNEKANKKAAKMLLASFDALYESSDEEKEEVVVAPRVPKVVAPKVEPKSTKYMDALLAPADTVVKKPKVIKPKVDKPKTKIDWANADSDSEGDESESD